MNKIISTILSAEKQTVVAGADGREQVAFAQS